MDVCRRELVCQQAALRAAQQDFEMQKQKQAEELGQKRRELKILAEEVAAISAQRLKEDDEVVMELKQSRQEICHLSEELQALKAATAAARERQAMQEVEDLEAQVLAHEKLARRYENSAKELHEELQHVLVQLQDGAQSPMLHMFSHRSCLKTQAEARAEDKVGP